MPIPKEALIKAILPAVGFLNRFRLGFPQYYFHGAGGIGDDLMATTIFRELRRRDSGRIAFATQHPGLFEQNPDVDRIIWHQHPRLRRWLREGLPLQRLGYAHYDQVTDRDEPLDEHVLKKLCRHAGIEGPIELRPYVYLTPAEMAGGRLADNQITIQSSARGAAFAIQNKEWFPERFQEVCTELGNSHTLVQIGSQSDPPMAGALDCRGKTSLRESAALLANSQVFLGLEGFLMHLARSVDCRSVIIYGGRLSPWQIGYSANANLVGATPCSPCWLRNHCDYGHECMNMISTSIVLAAVRQQLERHGQPLEIESATLGRKSEPHSEA